MFALHVDSLDPAFNLAFEEVLCADLPPGHPGWVLFWRNGPSVIVGRFQNTAAEVNAAFIAERGIPVVRRMTGGGAVYHDTGNLNFSFILPLAAERRHPIFADFSFAAFLRPMVAALGDVGAAATLSGRNDVLVDGAKCSGNAQRRTRSAMLHHGTLLVDLDMSVLGRALAGDPEKFASKGLASVRSRVTNLRPYLKPHTRLEDIMAAVAARCGLGDALRTLADMPAQTLAAAEQLADAKYRSWDWNYGHSPRFDEKRSCRFAWGRVDMLLSVERGVITGCAFHGDFFSAAEPEQISARLVGVPNRAEDIRQALQDAPLTTVFSGCEPDALLLFLTGAGAAVGGVE